MENSPANHAFSPTVGIVRLPSCSYPAADQNDNPVSQALSRLAGVMGWSDERGPFGRVVPPGARVLIKPNLVLHQNEGSGGLDCLVTHSSLIQAAVKAALQTEAAEIVVGDAPIQGCDFDALMESSKLRSWADAQMALDSRFKGVCDFRRTIGVLIHGVRVAAENLQSEDRFTLFDLGRKVCWNRSATARTGSGWLGMIPGRWPGHIMLASTNTWWLKRWSKPTSSSTFRS